MQLNYNTPSIIDLHKSCTSFARTKTISDTLDCVQLKATN